MNKNTVTLSILLIGYGFVACCFWRSTVPFSDELENQTCTVNDKEYPIDDLLTLYRWVFPVLYALLVYGLASKIYQEKEQIYLLIDIFCCNFVAAIIGLTVLSYFSEAKCRYPDKNPLELLLHDHPFESSIIFIPIIISGIMIIILTITIIFIDFRLS